jgi:hypothetical protein
MGCALCQSRNQGEFTAEMMIHFSGSAHIDNRGVLAFPKVSVCLDCGSSRFTISETDLALLAICSPKCDASTRKGNVRNVALGRSIAA